MTTRRSTKTTSKPKADAAAKPRKPRPARNKGESVIRHELLAACDIAPVPGTEAAIGKRAADALIAALHGRLAQCTVQCEDYVFNLSMLALASLEPDQKPDPNKTAS